MRRHLLDRRSSARRSCRTLQAATGPQAWIARRVSSSQWSWLGDPHFHGVIGGIHRADRGEPRDIPHVLGVVAWTDAVHELPTVVGVQQGWWGKAREDLPAARGVD